MHVLAGPSQHGKRQQLPRGHKLNPNPAAMAAAIKPPTRADKSQESLKTSFSRNGDLRLGDQL
jgi:hypothetical protein